MGCAASSSKKKSSKQQLSVEAGERRSRSHSYQDDQRRGTTTTICDTQTTMTTVTTDSGVFDAKSAATTPTAHDRPPLGLHQVDSKKELKESPLQKELVARKPTSPAIEVVGEEEPNKEAKPSMESESGDCAGPSQTIHLEGVPQLTSPTQDCSPSSTSVVEANRSAMRLMHNSPGKTNTSDLESPFNNIRPFPTLTSTSGSSNSVKNSARKTSLSSNASTELSRRRSSTTTATLSTCPSDLPPRTPSVLINISSTSPADSSSASGGGQPSRRNRSWSNNSSSQQSDQRLTASRFPKIQLKDGSAYPSSMSSVGLMPPASLELDDSNMLMPPGSVTHRSNSDGRLSSARRCSLQSDVTDSTPRPLDGDGRGGALGVEDGLPRKECLSPLVEHSAFSDQ